MASNRSNAPRRSPGRRTRPRQHRARNTLPSRDRSGSIFVDLMSVVAVAGEATKKDLTFSREVIADITGTPPTTDFVLTSAGETDRFMNAIEVLATNVLRVTLSGALTAAKTYVGTVAANAGTIRPEPAAWGDRTASIIVPP